MERMIGEKFEHGGKWYRVQPGDPLSLCLGCAFDGKVRGSWWALQDCDGTGRADRRNVIAVECEAPEGEGMERTIGEKFLHDGKWYRCDPPETDSHSDERPIGQEFEYKNQWSQVVEGDGYCRAISSMEKCFYFTDCTKEMLGPCLKSKRNDGKHVVFLACDPPESRYQPTDETVDEWGEEPCKYDPKSRYYDAGGIEVLEIIKAKLKPDQYRGYLLGNVIKYATRLAHKGQAKRDAEKLKRYAEWLRETFE